MVDFPAYSLAVDERNRLKNITTLALQNLIESYVDGDDLVEYVRRTPGIVNPYMEVASTSGAKYYNDARLLAQYQGVTFDEDYRATPIDVYTGNPNDKLYGSTGWYAKKVERESIDDFLALLPGLHAVVEKSIFNAWRDTVSNNTDIDPEAKYVSVITAPGACAWCLWLKNDDYVQKDSRSRLYARSVTQGGKSANFHDNCRCTYGVVFRGEERRKYFTDADKTFMEALDSLLADGVSGQDDILRNLRLLGYK